MPSMVEAVPVKIFLDEVKYSHHGGVENLRPAIGLIGRDAHLGHHLQNPLAHRLDVILLHFIGLQRQAESGRGSAPASRTPYRD